MTRSISGARKRMKDHNSTVSPVEQRAAIGAAARARKWVRRGYRADPKWTAER